MKVSIVTISYNQASFLQRAIESVLNQTYPHIEYIVVDPGSTDGSREIIEQYREKIAHIIFEKDSGAADGLAKGFAKSTGALLGYINSDDALLPDAIECAVKIISDSGADIVTGNGLLVDKDGNIIRRMHSGPYSIKRAVYGESVFVQQSTFFKRTLFDKVGGFNVENNVNWDAELMFDMVRAGGRVARSRKLLSIYTIHPDSITGSMRLMDLQHISRQRMYTKLTGREPGLAYMPYKLFAKLARQLGDPKAVVERIFDRILLRGKPSKKFLK